MMSREENGDSVKKTTELKLAFTFNMPMLFSFRKMYKINSDQ